MSSQHPLYFICGSAASGKDETAKWLLQFGVQQTSFAKVLKRFVADLFLLDGERMALDWTYKALHRPKLIGIGNRARELDCDVWVRHVHRELQDSSGQLALPTSVSDWRFRQELIYFQRLGWRCIPVRVTASEAVRQQRIGREAWDKYQKEFSVDVTERELLEYPTLYTLRNDTTLPELGEQVKLMMLEVSRG